MQSIFRCRAAWSAVRWSIVGAAALAAGCSDARGSISQDAESAATERTSQALTRSRGIDPGPRPGPANAGGPFPTLNADERAQFAAAQNAFTEILSVKGTLPGEPGHGLGPAFNGNACVLCHSQPTIGGTSPAPFSPQVPAPNPEIAVATLDGAQNVVPPFITAAGPIREARFIAVSNANNAPLDGSVHELFTIRGRSDAPGCDLGQPDFATQLANHNVIFRIPTPVFGVGLVENTSEETLKANLAANASAKAALGIAGRFNTSGNDQTITRFGWKAQNKSGLIFAAEASNIEMGDTNEGFQSERTQMPAPGCFFNPTPEDKTPTPPATSDVGTPNSRVTDLGIFMRFLAPPTPAPLSDSAARGEALFNRIGCALCHTPSLTTSASPFTGMSNVTFQPFSDFALHHMGGNLADGVTQGVAIADEFRTAPLWGVGQRLFFLHDGRSTDLGDAIEQHGNSGQDQVTSQTFEQFNVNGMWFQPFVLTQTPGSEAQAVVNNFNALKASQQTDLLNYLRAL